VGIDAQVGTSWLAAPFVKDYAAEVGACERVFDTTCKVGIGAYVLGVDLPLSAVADTLSLPITVPATLHKQGKPQAATEGGTSKDEDEEVGESGH
jgi:uncharacterized protein YceK